MTPAEQLAQKKKMTRRPRKSIAAPKKRPLTCGITELRHSMGLSLYDVADAIGMSRTGLWAIEKGNDVQVTTALKLCRFFGKQPYELWELNEEHK